MDSVREMLMTADLDYQMCNAVAQDQNLTGAGLGRPYRHTHLNGIITYPALNRIWLHRDEWGAGLASGSRASQSETHGPAKGKAEHVKT